MAVRRTFVGGLLRNRAAMMGLVILALVIVLAVLGPMVYPADPFGLWRRPWNARSLDRSLKHSVETSYRCN